MSLQEMVIERVDQKLDVVASDISDVKVTLARVATVLEMQKDVLDDHVRRTLALEDRVTQFEKIVAIHRSFYKTMAWAVPVVVSIVAIFFKVFM
jgi:hypothetical protein